VQRDDRQPANDKPGTFPPATRLLLAAAPVLLFGWIALATAWLSDDSLISLRQVWNFINGGGLTWNYGERVQAFTHPAWVLLLSAVTALTRELFLTTIVLSVALSLASVLFVMRYAAVLSRDRRAWIFAAGFLLALAFSKAFTDYMTSGLENPLSFFLVGATLWQVAELQRDHGGTRRLTAIFVLLALVFLNRFDLGLLLLPLALYLLVAYVGRDRLWSVVPGLAIIVGWLVFALVYFGAPLPNTYYAKLVAGFPAAGLHARGAAYFAVSWGRDPVTALLIVCGTVAGLAGRGWANRMLALGTLLYCAYLYNIGGDFMQGRFFAILAYVALFPLIAIDSVRKPALVCKAATLLVAVGLAAVGPKPVLSDSGYRDVEQRRGIGDARGFWYRAHGLLSPERSWPEVSPTPRSRPARYAATCAGAQALAHPEVYLIDVCALTDPLLARLPAIQSPDWRVGHHYRRIPTDYGEVRIGRRGRLVDDALQPLLDDVTLATTGPLFTRRRWQAIWRLNVGPEYGFDRRLYADPGTYVPRTSLVTRVEYAAIDRVAPEESARWLRPQAEGVYGEFEERATVFDTALLAIVQPSRRTAAIELSLDADDSYRVTVNGDQYVFDVDGPSPRGPSGRLTVHTIELPAPVMVAMVRIEPIAGKPPYAIGHLHLVQAR